MVIRRSAAEPNSNLDAAGEQALTDTLQRAKEKRITVVVITQRPAVLNCMDKLLILRTGRVEAFGPPSEVLLRVVRAPSARAPVPSDTADRSTLVQQSVASGGTKSSEGAAP